MTDQVVSSIPEFLERRKRQTQRVGAMVLFMIILALMMFGLALVQG